MNVHTAVAYRCRICQATVTGPADPAHDGAAHDARTADLPPRPRVTSPGVDL